MQTSDGAAVPTRPPSPQLHNPITGQWNNYDPMTGQRIAPADRGERPATGKLTSKRVLAVIGLGITIFIVFGMIARFGASDGGRNSYAPRASVLSATSGCGGIEERINLES